jgi:hypothetical protein
MLVKEITYIWLTHLSLFAVKGKELIHKISVFIVGKIYNLKCAILTILSVRSNSIKYIKIVNRSQTLSSYNAETLHQLIY